MPIEDESAFVRIQNTLTAVEQGIIVVQYSTENCHRGDALSMSHLIAGVVGAAVGDALGLPYDGHKRDTYRCEDMVPLGKRTLPIGYWSDDTSMILAELDSLAEKGEYDAEDVMGRFAQWIYDGRYTPAGQSFGVGRTTASAVSRYRSGTPADLCGGREILDNGGGALMRILPYALLKDPNRLNIVDAAGSLTHAHQISRQMCLIYCYLVDEFLAGRTPREALNAILDNDACDVPEHYLGRLQSVEAVARVSVPNSGFACDLLLAAIWCLVHTNNYVDAVLLAVNLGGDTDTLGSVTGGLAGILYGVGGEKGVPTAWSHALARYEDIVKLCERCDTLMR